MAQLYDIKRGRSIELPPLSHSSSASNDKEASPGLIGRIWQAVKEAFASLKNYFNPPEKQPESPLPAVLVAVVAPDPEIVVGPPPEEGNQIEQADESDVEAEPEPAPNNVVIRALSTAEWVVGGVVSVVCSVGGSVLARICPWKTEPQQAVVAPPQVEEAVQPAREAEVESPQAVVAPPQVEEAVQPAREAEVAPQQAVVAPPQVEVAPQLPTVQAALPKMPEASSYQREGIAFTIEKLGTLSIRMVTWNAVSLRGYERGNSQNRGLKDLHPLRFLSAILTAPTSSEKFPGICNAGSMIGSQFRSSLFGNLQTYHLKGELVPYLEEFVQIIGRPGALEELKAAAETADWKQFLKILVPTYNLLA